MLGLWTKVCLLGKRYHCSLAHINPHRYVVLLLKTTSLSPFPSYPWGIRGLDWANPYSTDQGWTNPEQLI